MGIAQRREREKQETRNKILEAAREMFANEGYEAVTMRRIAEKIEYSPTAIYFHFPDKLALFREICFTDFRELGRRFFQIAKVEDPVERIRLSGRAYVEFAVQNPNHYRLMFMTPHPPGHDEGAEIEKGNPEQDAYAFLLDAVEQALRAGRFRPELNDADLIAQTLWAGVHGVAALHVAMCQDEWVRWAPLEKRVDLMIDGALRSLVREGK